MHDLSDRAGRDLTVLLVVALGGNALLQRGQRPDAALQQSNVVAAVGALAPLAHDHDLVITHGNGPQIGVLALQSAADPNLTLPYPFDVLGAQTQGMIGYWLLQALQNELPGREVACIVNQTLVDADDPAFADPTKFIGEVYTEERARELATERGWTVRRDGAHWRRVVGSPEPLGVVESGVIRLLLDAHAVVVCAGGGGVPVVREADGRLRGVEAVVDKDHTASVLARSLDADGLLILTDVPHVYRDFGTPTEAPIGATTPEELRSLDLPAGSMGPKVDAACDFVEATGRFAGIGNLTDIRAIVEGTAGTRVRPAGATGGPLDPSSAP